MKRAGETEEERRKRQSDDAVRHRLKRAQTKRANSSRREEDNKTFGITAEELWTGLHVQGDGFFNDLPHSLKKAVLLFYVNSGLFRFDEWKEYSSEWDGYDIDQDKLVEELEQEMLSDAELTQKIRAWTEMHSYTKDKLMGCGACGLRIMERCQNPVIHYERFDLDVTSEMKIYRFNETEERVLENALQDYSYWIDIPIDESWNMKTICMKEAESYFEEKNTGSEHNRYWHLHRELVQHDKKRKCYYTHLCPHCAENTKKMIVPPLSIANGIDFGLFDRIELTYPNLQEQLIIAKTRLYFAAVKACSNVVGASCNNDRRHIARCNAILFPQDAPEVASEMFNNNIFDKEGILDPEHLKKLMMIFFVDDKGKTDVLAREVFGSANIMARHYVVAQWLIVLQCLNCHYKDMDVSHITEDRMKSLFKDLEDSMRKNSVVINDADAVEYERKLGSDVSSNQHHEVYVDAENTMRDEAALSGDGGVHVRYSIVTNTEEAYLAMNDNDYRLGALREFVEGYPQQFGNVSSRETDPLNDFVKDDKGLSTSFPHIFMLGTAYGKAVADIGPDQRFHLLNQFSLVAAQDRRLLGFLFDVMQRLKVFHSVKTCVEGNRLAMDTIQDLLQNPAERTALLEAIKYPYRESSKMMLRKYLKILRFAGKNVSYGALEGSTLKHYFSGISNRYSAPTLFLTISVENLSDPRSIRMACQSFDNSSFPAMFNEDCSFGASGEDFIAYMVKNSKTLSEGNIDLPEGVAFSKADRAKLAAENPIAFVQENKSVLNDLLSILIGLPPDGKGFYSKLQGCSRRRTKYYKENKGVFGHVLSLLGVTEDHAKGHLHWHLTVNSGISSFALQRFANLEKVCQSINDVLNSMYVSQLDRDVCIGTILREFAWDQRKRGKLSVAIQESLNPTEPLFLRPDPMRVIDEQKVLCSSQKKRLINGVIKAVQVQAGDQQFHRHQDACHERTWGLAGCRFNVTWTLQDFTCANLLKPRLEQCPEADSGNSEVCSFSLEELLRCPPSKRSRNTYDLSVAPPPIFGNDGTAEEMKEVVPDTNTIMEEKTSWYICHPLMGSNGETDKDKMYHLVDILDDTLEKEVVIWETERPRFDLPSFPHTFENEDDKSEFICKLQECLKEVPPFNDNQLSFWNWLRSEATWEQMEELYVKLKEKIVEANGYVASFNPIVSFCTGSHNNASLLGSLGQAKSAMFYLVPYQGKTKFDFQQSLTILNRALRYVDAHDSTAADSGSLQRTTKHFLTRALNRMHLQLEMSDYQIAAALLDLPSIISTDRFSYGNPAALEVLERKMQIDQRIRESDEDVDESIQNQQRVLYERLAAARKRKSQEDIYGINPAVDINMDDSFDSEDEFQGWGFGSDAEEYTSDVELNNDCDSNLSRMDGEFTDSEAALQFSDDELDYTNDQQHEEDSVNTNDTDDTRNEWGNNECSDEIVEDTGVIDIQGMFRRRRNDADRDRMNQDQKQENNVCEDILQDYGHIERILIRNGQDPKEQEDPKNPWRDILVPQVALFQFRGEELSKLNYYEYLACIKFENRPVPREEEEEGDPVDDEENDVVNNKNAKRREAGSKFEMDVNFEGYMDCRHCIRMKQSTPLLSGKKPTHPGTVPLPSDGRLYEAWKLKADNYAKYYLTLFLPGDYKDIISMDWNGLKKFVSLLQGDDNMISIFRLMMMRRHMRGLRTSEVVKKMTLDHKGRSRTIWSKKQRIERALKEEARAKNKAAFDLRCQDVLEEVTGYLPSRTNNEFRKQLRHDDDQIAALMKVANTFNPLQNNEQDHNESFCNNMWNDIMSKRSAAFFEQIVSEMHGWRKPLEEVDIEKHDVGSSNSRQKVLTKQRQQKLDALRESIVYEGGINTQQLQLFDLYRSHFVNTNCLRENNPPLIALIHGPPGSGKSEVRRSIAEASKICGRFNIKTAFNGINAVEMGGHTTAHLVQLCNGKHMIRLGDIRNDVVKSLKDDGFNTDSMIFIEECSTQAPWHLARLSHLCETANRCKVPFGGCLTTIFGDFNQLGPVMAGASITQAIMDIYADEVVRGWMNRNKNPGRATKSKTILPSIRKEDNKYRENHPYTIGAGLLTKARWFEITQQRRSKDAKHTELITKTYRGEPITMEDLKSRLKILSEKDCTEMEWIRAPVLTATNRERCSLTHERAIQFAKATGTVVIRWLRENKAWQQKPKPEFCAEAMDDPVFYEYYVTGCDGFLTECINRDLNLVNALSIRYRSIKFEGESETFLRKALKTSSPGDVITMTARPLCINVEIILPKDTPEYVKNALNGFSIVKSRKDKRREDDMDYDDNPVIPIYHKSCRWDTRSTVIHGGSGFQPSRAIFRQYFPVEPAFAITVHKGEGRTMDRVIVALSHSEAKGCNFSYAQLHVALSRVQYSEHMRLLLTGNSEWKKWMSIRYIESLEADPSVSFYFGGFRDIDNDNPNDNWLHNQWDPVRANEVFKKKHGISIAKSYANKKTSTGKKINR